jgi:pyruvate dehydrogenase E2 component (dihydrolipoamide acetyltransferase)
VDLDAIPGTGPGGRVTKEDVERAGTASPSPVGPASAAAPMARPRPQPAAPLPGIADADKWGPIRRESINQIRKTIANQMTRSAFTAVHVTHGDFADITELDRIRRQLNDLTNNDPKLTIMTFVVRAACVALKRHPIFNASFDEEGGPIIYKDYVSIGVAVDTPRGLIVPVIRNADQLTLRGIAGALRGIAERVRTNQFGIEDLRGGTFTITNVGALGGTFSTPIINFPEVAILGLGRSREMAVVRNGQVVPGLTLPINLSFDHRVTDGANAARFAGEIVEYLEKPAKLLLD